jgi:hypothetical protein
MNPLLAALGLLIQKFGNRIPGGFEVTIPPSILNINPAARLQQERMPDGGSRVRYFPNQTVEGKLSQPSQPTETKTEQLMLTACQ